MAKMGRLFKKKEIFRVKSLPVDPLCMEEPSTVDEFQQRGMAFYARKEYSAAEDDLNKAILLSGSNIDSLYSLGMVLKAMNRKKDSVSAFKQVLDLIMAKPGVEKTKYDMLRRLALGHINIMTQGDWNLEKEIWQHTA
jgi:tetratricopeptide (TPR) repeat protein